MRITVGRQIVRAGRIQGDENQVPFAVRCAGSQSDPSRHGPDGKEDPNGNGDPFGGDLLVEGSIELIFPLPFIKDQNSVRTAFFIDGGNVFSTSCQSSQLNCYDLDLGQLRYSAGVGLTWITGFGPLTFSLAKPFNEDEYDQDEVFQFTLGRGF